MRIWTAVAAAVLLVLEALVFGVAGLVLGAVAERQNMSFGGLAPKAMAVGAWVGLGLLAVFLVVVALVLVLMAVWRRAMGRPTRILLIVCAVLHGVLATALLALSGVPAFVGMLLTLGLLVLLLFTPTEPGSGPGPGPVSDVVPKPAL